MRHFTLKELTHSATALRLGIDNTPGPREQAALRALVDNLLDPLRDLWGHPIIVTSGFRSPALNRAVGGAPSSHHLRGMAADIRAHDPALNGRLLTLILTSKLPFTQAISEKGTPACPAWIHLSYNPLDPRRQSLRIP